MAGPNYTAVLKQTLVYEGGWSHHPRDPGGVTLEGVIQTRYDEYRRSKGLPKKALVPSMRGTPEWIAERNEIYRRYYWDVVRGDALPYGVDMAVFDYAVNSGPARALNHFKPYEKLDPIGAIKGLCKRRLAFVRALSTWDAFGKGWGARIANVEAIGVKMWLKFKNAVAPDATQEAKDKATAEIKKELEKHAAEASKTANGQIAGGTTVGTGTGGAVAADPSIVQWDWVTIGVGVFVVVAAVVIGYRIYVNLARKKAYTDVAATA